MNYDNFLKEKMNYGKTEGIIIEREKINKLLFEFQKDITLWALRKGRSAIFADTGLGKTFMQVEWAKAISDFGKIIIFAPLSVNEQTIEEAQKLNIKITRFDIEDNCNIKICNYENLNKLNENDYIGIVLDESSILKSLDGKTKFKLIEFSKKIKYRLCCTATPAPNDISEIANHSEFLGILKREEMLAKYFYNNGKDWNIKGHAINHFYKWLATWGFYIKKPSDIGYLDDEYVLPRLNFEPLYHKFEFKGSKNLTLFSMGLKGIEDRIKIRKESLRTKITLLADIINKSKEQWIVWCGINEESELMNELIKDSENLQGNDSNNEKIRKIKEFKIGMLRVLVTKPKIAGFGINFQNCHNMAFLGLSDSYESYYQCIRRCYRFGQKKDVNVFISLAGDESEILQNVLRKEKIAEEISTNVIKHVKDFEMQEIKGTYHERGIYMTNKTIKDNYTLILGDSCIEIKNIEENSIDFSIFSPPFASLYTYSPSERDLGNCQNDEEFFIHFEFIIKELLRIIKPGRNIAVHCMNLPTKKIVDGFIGIKDFRGDIIRLFQKCGFIYHSEVCIDKNPQVAAIRTHAKGLMFKQMHKDSSHSRMGLADYIVCFKKPGENKIPIIPDIDNDTWIRLAHPIWYGINETNTLNSIKSENDEKHMCPLQLEVIENCLNLWSNKKEIVFSPFAGIGSEGYQALLMDRKFIGIELKEEYYKTAIDNLEKAIFKKINKENTLFKINE